MGRTKPNGELRGKRGLRVLGATGPSTSGVWASAAARRVKYKVQFAASLAAPTTPARIPPKVTGLVGGTKSTEPSMKTMPVRLPCGMPMFGIQYPPTV